MPHTKIESRDVSLHCGYWFLRFPDVSCRIFSTSLLQIREVPSRHTTSFQRLYDVYTTSLTSYRRRIDVETTSCVYWVYVGHFFDIDRCMNLQYNPIFHRHLHYMHFLLRHSILQSLQQHYSEVQMLLNNNEIIEDVKQTNTQIHIYTHKHTRKI